MSLEVALGDGDAFFVLELAEGLGEPEDWGDAFGEVFGEAVGFEEEDAFSIKGYGMSSVIATG
jgi:hypothetical protein